MATIYLVTLCFGILYAFALFMMGKNKQIAAAVGEHSSSLYKPTLVAIFMMVFGITGMMTLRLNWSTLNVFFISLCFGVFVAISLNMAIFDPLRKLHKASIAAQKALNGCEALVTDSILQGGVGAISYQFNGITYSGSAKSQAGQMIDEGAKVRITRFEGAVYIVEKI